LSKYKQFFSKDGRKKQAGETFDFEGTLKEEFSRLQTNYPDKIFKDTQNISENPLYNTLIRLYQNQDIEATTADEAFSKYIIEGFEKTTKDYFLFLLKFSILFRECLNQYKPPTEPGKQFSENNGAEHLPDLCNEFVTEFMENNDYFGLDVNELIELIQQFCHWLYESKYTTSRLTLLSS
jgi:hypothetical protein